MASGDMNVYVVKIWTLCLLSLNWLFLTAVVRSQVTGLR